MDRENLFPIFPNIFPINKLFMKKHCIAYITITGNKKEIHALREDFSNFPNVLKSFKIEQEETRKLIVSGATHEAPDLPLFRALSAEYQQLKMRYEYENADNDMAGWADIKEGVIANHNFTHLHGLLHNDYGVFYELTLDTIINGGYDSMSELLSRDFWQDVKPKDKKTFVHELKNYLEFNANTIM